MFSKPLAFAVLGLAGIAFVASAEAQERCRVMDPTGTPLNVRTKPNGEVIGQLPNGLLVAIIDQANDKKGQPWVYVRNFETRKAIGWVFREFIACF